MNRLLNCYTFQASPRVGLVYACSRDNYADFRAKLAASETWDLPEVCPPAQAQGGKNRQESRQESKQEKVARKDIASGEERVSLVPLERLAPKQEQEAGGRYLFVLDDARDLWSWALLPTRLVSLAAEEQFVLVGAEEALVRHHAVLAWGLASYSFEHFRTRVVSRPLRLLLGEGDRAFAEEARILCHGRDLINTPANVLGTVRSEQEVRAAVEQSGGVVRSLCGEALLAANYPLIHAVGRSAREEPRLLEVRWDAPEQNLSADSSADSSDTARGKSRQPRRPKQLAIVGKGVCFDSGGLNIKDARSMRLMKKDMGGLAHALALALLLRERKVPLALRLLLPVVENAVSRDAMRPSDIYTSRKGDTVEIGHTDAEGRLLLADALWEASAPCQESAQPLVPNFPAPSPPDLVVDFATLTGAARVATGPLLPNMFANDDALAEQLLACARETQDPLWRMPLWQDYRHALRSHCADLSSSGSWPYAGSITAALFLQNFVAQSILWIHLDVMAWNERTRAGRPEGGELQGVRALASFLEAWSYANNNNFISNFIS